MPYSLAHGNPCDLTRLQTEQESYALLDSLGISYDRVDHEPLYTMEACREVDDVLGVTLCKNLFLKTRTGTAYFLLLMPADKPFKTKELSAQLGTSRLSFATAEEMQDMLSVTPGSVTVLGLMHDKDQRVQLLIDADVAAATDFGCHPCINTSSLRFSTADLMEKLIPALHHTPRIVTLVGESNES